MSDLLDRILQGYADRSELEHRQARSDGGPPVSDILREFFDKAAEGMFITTVGGTFVMANAAFGRMLEYSPAELLRLPVSNIYALPAERRRFRGTVEASGRVHNFRLTFRTRTGDELATYIDAVAWKHADGSVGGYAGTARTESRPVIVRNDMSQFELAVEGGAEGLWTWNLETDEVRFSRRFKQVLGFEDHELHDSLHEWISRIHPDDVAGFKEALSAHLKRSREVFLCYFRMRNSKGEYLWMMARGTAQFGQHGKPQRIAGSLSNVSSHMQIIAKLRQEGEQLEDERKLATLQRDLFSRYVPAELREELADRGQETIRPRNSQAAVLVARIEQIDYYHSRLSPEHFSEFLNEILTDMSDLVDGNRGIVARMEGDQFVATFGALRSSPADVDNCFQTAVSIARYIRTYNDVRDENLGREVTISLGISYGPIFTGSIGNVHRLEYSVFGLPIRRAQVLQARCRTQNTGILADRNAASRLTLDLCLRSINLEQNSGSTLVYAVDPDAEAGHRGGCRD